MIRWTPGSLTARLAPLAVLVAALHLPVAAQEAPFPVPRLSGPVEIDGRVDEAAWMAIPPLEVSASLPTFGRPPSERTEIRIAYDDTYLYVAGRMYDSDPGGIRATSLRRDEASLGNDWLVLNLDTFMEGIGNPNALREGKGKVGRGFWLCKQPGMGRGRGDRGAGGAVVDRTDGAGKSPWEAGPGGWCDGR